MAAAVVTAFALVTGTAACGGGGSGADSDTIELWLMGDKAKAMDTVSTAFTAETGIKVKVQSIPWKNARDKMSTAIASGDGPDVVQVGHSFLAEFADAGALLDLSDKVAGTPELAAANFFPASAETMQVGGKVVSVPWIADTRVLFYRTDVLQEAGYPQAPATWDELKGTATKLAARGDGNYGIGLNTDDQFLPIILTWQAGGEVAQGDRATFDTAPFRRAVEFERSFFTAGLTPKKAQPDADMVQGFKTGKIPMFVSGPYMATLLGNQAPELAGKWAVAPMPKDRTGTSLMAGSNLAIFSESEKADESVQLMAYLSRKQTQEQWFQATNDLPARQDSLEALGSGGDANLAVYYRQMSDAKIVPQIKAWGAVAPEMVRLMQQVCVGDNQPESAITGFAAKAGELTGAG
ncbi:sugar ABC transporter substrate-binding protein [Polymorphospora rubra]|uniref:Sugar ABC transporter substrate-binding protein n=1 Tax=Polymorphospora rubra TaxID=338584 RepID=A0A810MT08_9ACTN|nr:sugar ABC transporter substrate-binding protein [Polymorphospora rubra]